MIALIGITIERNVTSMSRNARPEDEGEHQRHPLCEQVAEVALTERRHR